MMNGKCGEVLSVAIGDFDGDLFPDKTNFSFLDHWASVWPEKEAYVVRPSETERESITYGELKTATENLAIWLKREFGLEKGDRVGILSLNRLSYVLCVFALCRLGVVSVRMYVTMDSKVDLTSTLSITGCRLLLCQHASLESINVFLPLKSHDVTKRMSSPVLPKIEHVICMTGEEYPGTIPLPDWRRIQVDANEIEELYKIQASITLKDDCTILSTSGSTGVPKFVVHSFGLTMRFPGAALRRSGLAAEDRYFTDRPLAHAGGSTMSLLTVGATMVIADTWKTMTRDPSRYIMTIVKEEKITCGRSFTYLLYDVLKNEAVVEQLKKTDIKFFLCGGEKANADIVGSVVRRIGAPLVNGYGTTETGNIACTRTTDSVEVTSTSTGQVLPGIEVKIVDDVTREILPRGHVGRLAVRTKHIWRYLNNEEKMLDSHDEEGFFYPGDVARMAENGNMELLGRDDDVMSVGTVKIYPGPIEMKLYQHPNVDKAIVFGVPDPRLYEVIGAVVLPKQGTELTSEEMIKFFENSQDKNELMTGTAYTPKFVWVVRSFPSTASGKVDKKALKKQCLEKLGL